MSAWNLSTDDVSLLSCMYWWVSSCTLYFSIEKLYDKDGEVNSEDNSKFGGCWAWKRGKKDSNVEVDYEKEVEVARRVIDNFVNSVASGLDSSHNDNSKTTENTDGLENEHKIVGKESYLPGKESGSIESKDKRLKG